MPRLRGPPAPAALPHLPRGHRPRGLERGQRLQLLLKCAGIVTAVLEFRLGNLGWANSAVPVSLNGKRILGFLRVFQSFVY